VIDASATELPEGVEHGSLRASFLGCHCLLCLDERAAYQRDRRNGSHRQKSSLVASRHINWLIREGFSMRAIARASGLSEEHVRNIRDRKNKRIRLSTEIKILAVHRLKDKGGRGHEITDSAPSQKIFRELRGYGFTHKEIAEMLGYKSHSMAWVYRPTIRVEMAARVEALYRELMTS
jgi:hypothetical protein